MSEGIQIPDALLAVIEQALNRYIALDPEGQAGFAALEGRIIAIEVKGFGTRVTVLPGQRGLQLFGLYDAEPDCLIHGTPLGLARMGMAERKAAQLISGEVEIEGDTALAQSFSQALAHLDVDWEEQLARVLGDPFAHQLGNRARAAADWRERASETMNANLREYLQEERRLLPTRYEVEAFLEQVDILRDDVERLAARIERLITQAADLGTQQ
ncbi:ubiquinone biosynthesis accessory factor UbiJ [Marichromatium gracile]|uniref:Ubiquinone biosynthesis accessory factor UbiJ n=1 Tax=Marichromatium gracile TaxID=1048 RepID=A0A4V2WAP1_MARGR|nr:SCP2 sterol-binding domain-containing protein [Marichromatium gracile]MBK1707668.1 sterol-binding protein [Marichromatium gracile]TCW40020.1 ubiquinone biosynthesis protein UbiJ [Marichromatium gracile]